MLLRAASRSLPWLFTLLALCYAAAAAQKAAVRDAVTDPVCVTWEKGCVLQRYSSGQGQWLTWEGPRSVLPLKVVPAVGPHAAAALDPMRGCSGWLFDLHAEKWTAIPKSPIPPPAGMVTPSTAAFVGDRLVVWGRIGRDEKDDAPQGAVLDTKTMTWTPMAKAPVAPRYRCVTVVVGSRLLLWGGYGPTAPKHIGPLADGASYDVDKDAWDKLPDPPVAGDRYGCSAVAWNGRMVIIGGRRGREVVKTGMIYDPDARRWEKLTDMPGDLGVQAACVVSGDRLFVWSGAGGAGSGVTGDGAVYDFSTGKWEELPLAPIPPRLLPFACAAGTRVTFWGGWLSRGGPTSLTDGAVYDVAQKRWQPIAPMAGDVPYELHPGW